VPQDTSQTSEAYLGDGRNYFRYEILEGGSAIRRSRYGNKSSSTLPIDGSNRIDGSVNEDRTETHWTAAVASGQRLTISIENRSGNNIRRLDYVVSDAGGGSVCSGRLNRNED